jgi:hypothetical protein
MVEILELELAKGKRIFYMALTSTKVICNSTRLKVEKYCRKPVVLKWSY